MLLCVGLVVVVGVLAGCGGAGNPGGNNLAVAPAGNVSPQANDPAVVGTWMLVWGTSNGVVVPPRNITGWWTGSTRELVVLVGNGTCTDTYYNASGGTVHQNPGTWSGTGGKGTIRWTTGGTTTPIPFTYTFQGANVVTWSFTLAGRQTVASWAKIATLTAHDAALVKTWKATSVWVNGVAKPVSYLTGNTTYPTLARRFAADGTCQDYLLKTDMERKLPELATKTWASGGGVLQLGTGPIAEQIYTVTTGQLTTWQLDAAGNTVKIVFKPYGAAGAHDARFVGTWHPVSGTVDGKATPVMTMLKNQRGTTSLILTGWADGTCESSNYAGTTLFYGELNTWYTAGGKFTIVGGGGPMTFGYVFGAGTMTWSWTAGGHKYVMICNKLP
jgi:hypothetical protein